MNRSIGRESLDRKGFSEPASHLIWRGVALFLQQINKITPRKDQYGMLIGSDFLVRLPADVGCGDQDTELPVAQPRDQASGLLDTQPTPGGVIELGLQGEK
jgi:hypothetical protein